MSCSCGYWMQSLLATSSICTYQKPPQRGGAVPDPVWVGSKWLLAFPRVQLPWELPFIFSLCCPLNDRSRSAHSFFKIGRLFSLSRFSCPCLSRLRLLILLLLLMSGNVHPNLGPFFPCSVCTGNVTWQGKSVQCCTCSKWVYLRCSQLFLSKFKALGSSHSWSCPPSFHKTVIPSSDSSNMYTSTVQSAPPLLMQHSHPTLVFKPLIPHQSILYLLPLPPHNCPLLLAVLLRLLLLFPLTLSGFFNGIQEVFKPGTLNYFTFSRPSCWPYVHPGIQS